MLAVTVPVFLANIASVLAVAFSLEYFALLTPFLTVQNRALLADQSLRCCFLCRRLATIKLCCANDFC
jgi:hypothetical protein